MATPPFDPKNLKNIDPDLAAKQISDPAFLASVDKALQAGKNYSVKPFTSAAGPSPAYGVDLDSPMYGMGWSAELFDTYKQATDVLYDYFAPMITYHDAGFSWKGQTYTNDTTTPDEGAAEWKASMDKLRRRVAIQAEERKLPPDFTENRSRVAEGMLDLGETYLEELLVVARKHRLLPYQHQG